MQLANKERDYRFFMTKASQHYDQYKKFQHKAPARAAQELNESIKNLKEAKRLRRKIEKAGFRAPSKRLH